MFNFCINYVQRKKQTNPASQKRLDILAGRNVWGPIWFGKRSTDRHVVSILEVKHSVRQSRTGQRWPETS